MARQGENGGDSRTHAARDVRQGEIILRTKRRRAIFIAGLAGFVLLALLGAAFGYR